MERPSRVVRKPFEDLGMFVGSVIVDDGVDDFAGRHVPFDGVEKANEFLMPMLLHAASDDRPIKNIQRGKERRRAITLVVMGHRSAFSRLERQARLSAVERLDLAFLVDGDDDGVSRRIHVKANDVLDLLGEFGIVGAFERAQAVGLKTMSRPQALDGSKRNVERLGHRAAGPMGGLSGRFRTGQLQHFRDGLCGQRRLAGFARLVMQEPINTLLAVSLLPAPYCGTTEASLACHFNHRQAFSREQDDLRPLDMLQWAIAVADNGEQSLAISHRDDDIDSLGHATRFACPAKNVNLMKASIH